jgi:hypothetical protein
VSYEEEDTCHLLLTEMYSCLCARKTQDVIPMQM